jgi:Zn-dependent peptidase ImmA (M78 family)
MDSARLRKLAKCCVGISGKAATDDGFVPIRKLSEAFNAEIECRPLLVEGMIAKPKDLLNADGSRSKWKILIDSEKLDINSEKIALESSASPLPERVRFTVAHELAHTLAFRSSEFGVELDVRKGGRQSNDEFVEALEAETNTLTPLLLVPDEALLKICVEESDGLSLPSIVRARERWGVSRNVFVSRLNLLAVIDESHLRSRNSLSGMIVGVGEWRNSESASLFSWPIHSNFGNVLVPEFITRLRNKGACALSEVAPLDSVVDKGDGTLEFVGEFPVGTSMQPSSEEALVKFTFENVTRRAGQTFLYLIKPGFGLAKTPLNQGSLGL